MNSKFRILLTTLLLCSSTLIAAQNPNEAGAIQSDADRGSTGGTLQNWIQLSSINSAGGTIVIPASDPNNASWTFNTTDFTYADRMILSATITHDGFLNGNYGLDHMAIGLFGPSNEGLLSNVLGLPSNTTTAFFWGEDTSVAAANPALLPYVQQMLRGRGITIWPAGNPVCRNTGQPCLIFESFTYNQQAPGQGLICSSYNPGCSSDTTLPLSSASFSINIVVTPTDITASVSQNGVVVASVGCRAKSNQDNRCSIGDVTQGDAFATNVISSPIPYTARRIGITNVQIRTQVFEQEPCPIICP